MSRNVQLLFFGLGRTYPLWGPLEEVGGVCFKGLGELPDYLETDIGHSSLNTAHVSPVDPSVVSQLLLGDALSVPDPAQVGGKELAEIHALNQPLDGLPSHGFKAEIISDKPDTSAVVGDIGHRAGMGLARLLGLNRMLSWKSWPILLVLTGALILWILGYRHTDGEAITFMAILIAFAGGYLIMLERSGK